MEVQIAQREVREVFLGGSVGQAVSGLIWLLSAALGTWVSTRYAILALALVGAFIFPLTQLVIRSMGRKASLSKDNPLNALAMQVAFIVPLSLPVIGAATLYRLNWFYPAFMVVLGTHYMPFIFLYGMRAFAVLAGLLIGGGVVIGMYFSESFIPGGYFTAAVLLGFAAVAWSMNARVKHPSHE
jgi:hypothetical protein